jgi:hypothetical protein
MLSHNVTESPRPRRMQWWPLCLLVAVIVTCTFSYRQTTAPYREAEKIHVQILSLADRRPAEMTQSQWDSAVSWTNNLHANSLVWGFKNAAPIRSLRLQIESRLDGPVTMDTIIWIWDQYAELCPLGARYQKWRKVMLEEIERGGRSGGL